MDRRRTITFLLAAVVTVFVGTLAGVSGAFAGTDENEIVLVSTEPDDGDVLTATPNEIVLRFQDRLPAIEPIVVLQNENSEPQQTGQPIAIDNRTALRVRVLRALPAGVYTVKYTLRPTNAAPVAGEFSFTLRAPDPDPTDTANVPTTVRPIDPTTIEVDDSNNYGGLIGTVGRFLAFFGLAAVAGGLLLIALAWAEGVEYVLTVKHLWTGWAVGVIGCLLTVGTAASDLNNGSIARALLPTEWGELLETTPGKALVIRLAAMTGCVWVAARPERVVDHGTKLMALAVPGIALATYGWSRPTDDNVAAIPAGIAHAVGGAAWLGGTMLLVRVVLAGPGEQDLVGAVRGFRRIYVLALIGIVVSGAVQTSIFLGGSANLTDTTYGRIFLLKIVVVAAMAFVATANRGYARQRLGRAQHLDARVATRLHRSVRTEVLAGALVVLLAGWLMGTPAPGTNPLATASTGGTIYESEDGTFRAEVEMSPLQVGRRVDFHFRLLEPESIEDGVVRLTPNDGKSLGIEIPIEGSPNYGFGNEQGFVFGSSGVWTITIDGTGPDGVLPTITDTFIVRNEDGTLPRTATTTTTTRTSVASDDATDDATDTSGTTDSSDG
jgi:copper transport protein